MRDASGASLACQIVTIHNAYRLQRTSACLAGSLSFVSQSQIALAYLAWHHAQAEPGRPGGLGSAAAAALALAAAAQGEHVLSVAAGDAGGATSMASVVVAMVAAMAAASVRASSAEALGETRRSRKAW